MQHERGLHWQIYSAKAFYFLGGFGFTTWASLIPFLKRNLDIPADHLGFLLLGIGLGALIMMMMAGTIAARLGCRRSLTIAGLCIAAFLNLLCYMPVYGLAVFTAVCLGASLGLMDVVVNINGIFIERKVKTRIMSGLQAMWSLGNFMGAAFFAFLLQFQLPWRGVAFASSAVIIACVVFFAPHLHNERQAAQGRPHFIRPKGQIAVIGIICMIAFLVEGAIDDWSGVFMTLEKCIDISRSGLGLTLFTAASFITRLAGDTLTMHWGPRRLLSLSLPIAFVGFIGLLTISEGWLLFLCFILIGLGTANTVPIFYSVLGRQKVMPVADAVSSVSTIGYAGILLAPAVLGFIGRTYSLYASFSLVTILLVVMAGISLKIVKE